MKADDKKPNRTAVGATESEARAVVPIAVKVAAELSGVPYVGPLVGAVADLFKERIARTRDSMHRETEQRLMEFYAEMLNADAMMGDEVARAMVDDKDFHALLRACVADIEGEKVGAYANLARGIATGAVAKQWRRHFIVSLRDLSAEELECLRGALIAQNHQLIPARGPSLGQEHFLRAGHPGTPQAIWMSNLAARGLIHNGNLSQAGEKFTRACYLSKELTPGSIGYRVWTGHKVAIVCYELGGAKVDGLPTTVQDALREAGIKSNVLAVVRDNWKQARMVHTIGVVLVRQRTRHLDENLSHLAAFVEKVPTMLVDVEGRAGEISEAQLFTHVNGSGMEEAQLVANVSRHVIAKARELDMRQRQ